MTKDYTEEEFKNENLEENNESQTEDKKDDLEKDNDSKENETVQSVEDSEESNEDAKDQEESSEDAQEETASESDTDTEEAPFNEGDTVTGTVYKIEDKFVKAHLEGTDYEGIIPISQLTNQRIEKPEEIVNIDDTISGVVIKVETEDNRKNVILSMRKLDETKVYDSLKEAKENDETITGKVTEVVKAGLVLDVGVRGFIPASLISDTYVEDLSQFEDQELEVKIEEIEFDKNRVILNRKRIVEADKNQHKKEQLESLNVGDIVEGEVVRTTDFGAFVDLGSVDGLVHISQLSYRRVDKVEDAVQIGQKVQVKILDVKVDEERISLSMKQAQESPFDTFAESHKADDVITGTVKRLVDFGAFVEVAPGVEGLVHVSEISHDHVNVPSDVLEVDQDIEVKILSINEEQEKISLSIKANVDAPSKPKRERKERNEEPRVYQDDTNSEEPTLGDLFGDKFKDFKG